MYNPKTEIYNALKDLGYACKQGNQDTFNSVPAITFTIGENVPQYTLNKEVSASNIQAIVDIWADDSITASRIAGEAELAMRNIDYLLTYSADIPFPAGSLFHIQMRYDAIKN